MIWICNFLASLVLVAALEDQVLEDDKQKPVITLGELELEHVQSPMLEVLMHLPPGFRDVKSFRSTLAIKPERLLERESEPGFRWKRKANPRSFVNVRSYKIAQPSYGGHGDSGKFKRIKREAESLEKGEPMSKVSEPEKLVSPLVGNRFGDGSNSEALLPMPDAIRGPIYTTYPVKEFDIIDINNAEDPRRRKNDSVDNRDESSQRDKRTFLDGEDNGETTTSPPFWKRKKESPPFITGRGGAGGSGQKDNGYIPPQHRSSENARESHSLKGIDKTVQSNEILRSNQDNYHSSTNRRAYSRQSDNVTPSTPKSVYDQIDYSRSSNSKRNNQNAVRNFARNHEEKKENLREGRITHEQYNNRYFQYNQPGFYDRSPYYQPPYPYPTEVLGRGVEYYHRTYDPTTGRIIYYANMPENGRSNDYRFMDPISRNFYVNNRPYVYDPYYRNYVPPYDYRFPNGFGRSMDYLRNGRSSQSYSYQDRDKFPRDARFNGPIEKDNRAKEEFRNKTYIIYDADESRSHLPKTQYSPTLNRYTISSNSFKGPQIPLRQPPAFPPPVYNEPFPFRNRFLPSPPASFWGFNVRSGNVDPGFNAWSYQTPEVQLPITTSTGGFHSSRDLDKSKKS